MYGFRRQRRHKKWRRRRRTSPAGTVSQPIGKPFNGQAKGLLWLTWRSYAGPPQYFIPPEGGSPEPVREALAGPGQNPWRPGPKARRRHQPSPAKAGVNLREYWKAPPSPHSLYIAIEKFHRFPFDSFRFSKFFPFQGISAFFEISCRRT